MLSVEPTPACNARINGASTLYILKNIFKGLASLLTCAYCLGFLAIRITTESFHIEPLGWYEKLTIVSILYCLYANNNISTSQRSVKYF